MHISTHILNVSYVDTVVLWCDKKKVWSKPDQQIITSPSAFPIHMLMSKIVIA